VRVVLLTPDGAAICGLPRWGVREPAIRGGRALDWSAAWIADDTSARGIRTPGLDIAISDYDSEY
jgi:hypothetical protein